MSWLSELIGTPLRAVTESAIGVATGLRRISTAGGGAAIKLGADIADFSTDLAVEALGAPTPSQEGGFFDFVRAGVNAADSVTDNFNDMTDQVTYLDLGKEAGLGLLQAGVGSASLEFTTNPYVIAAGLVSGEIFRQAGFPSDDVFWTEMMGEFNAWVERQSDAPSVTDVTDWFNVYAANLGNDTEASAVNGIPSVPAASYTGYSDQVLRETRKSGGEGRKSGSSNDPAEVSSVIAAAEDIMRSNDTSNSKLPQNVFRKSAIRQVLDSRNYGSADRQRITGDARIIAWIAG